jgi:hypothetical protein
MLGSLLGNARRDWQTRGSPWPCSRSPLTPPPVPRSKPSSGQASGRESSLTSVFNAAGIFPVEENGLNLVNRLNLVKKKGMV